MPASIQAVIWDMGGVLLRTENRQPRMQLAKKYGISYSELDQIVFASESAHLAEMGEITDTEHWGIVADRLGIPPAEMQEFQSNFWAGDAVDEPLVAWICTLKPAYKLGFLSNAWTGSRKIITERYPNLLGAFDVSVFSAEVGIRKPDKRIFDLVINRLGIQSHQAVFVDDFIANVEGARDAGLLAVHFQNSQQAIDEISILLRGASGK